MKTLASIATVVISSVVIISVVIIAAASLTFAADSHTVISVTGKAWHKTEGQDWRRLKSGDRLADQEWVRTAAKANVRLVRADGSLMRIAENQEQQIGANPPPDDEDKGWGFFAMLDELFSDEKSSRAAASRGARTDSGPDPQQAAYYDAEWQELIVKTNVRRKDLPRIFETASFYQERAYQNRAVSLVIKLANDFPDDDAFSQMARQARKAFGNPARLEMAKQTESGVEMARNGDTLQAGDGLQVRYQSETESYIYLYIHTIPAAGEPSTDRIYPGRRGVRMVPPASPASLPPRGKYLTLDDTVGREYLWIWSCTAPVADADAAAAANRTVAALSASGHLDHQSAQTAAPDLCPQGFGYAFDHR